MLLDVSRETRVRLDVFADLLRTEATRQNLIAASTVPDLWSRHIVDSAQLVPLGNTSGRWLDIGSGAGLPGLVCAILRPGTDTILVEPRALRADFLRRCIERLGMAAHVKVVQTRLEAVPTCQVQAISARAVAPLDRLFAMAARFATDDTVWLLPKGRTAAAELASAREAWQGQFQLVPSVTDPAARIVVARHVGPKERR